MCYHVNCLYKVFFAQNVFCANSIHVSFYNVRSSLALGMGVVALVGTPRRARMGALWLLAIVLGSKGGRF